MCFDFTDLNKACPKNKYLPKIDQLIDANVVHELFIFLDAYYVIIKYS